MNIRTLAVGLLLVSYLLLALANQAKAEGFSENIEPSSCLTAAKRGKLAKKLVDKKVFINLRKAKKIVNVYCKNRGVV